MLDISKEMDEVAESMEKSVEVTAFSMDILKSTILRLGPDGLKKAFTKLDANQQNLLKGVLEDMKSHSTEPASTTPKSGDEKSNETKPKFDEIDEDVMKEAEKRKQADIRNQGGVPIEGWEGQIIKAKEVSKEEAKDKIMAMEVKEHGINDPKKLVEAEAKEHAHKEGETCEKCDYGNAAQPLAKKQGVPKGVDPKKHEDCVKDVKAEGHSKQSAFAICNASMKKGEMMESCEDSSMEDLQKKKKKLKKKMKALKKAMKMKALEEKKQVAKENLHKMMKRMQERSMKKSACISALAKSLGADETKLGHIWDLLEKGESYKYDDGTVGKAPEEATRQSEPSAIMKDNLSAGVHDQEDPSTPVYKDKEAKKKGEEKKPMSGEATQEADETISKVPSTMKKGFFTDEDTEESVGLNKSQNPFAVRKIGQNVHYSVDELIELQHVSQEQRLKKSTFDYLSDEQVLVKSKKKDELKKDDPTPSSIPPTATLRTGGPTNNPEVASSIANAFGKSEDEAAQQVRANAKANAEAKRDEKQNLRNAQLDEKLTRIEERAGPKVPMVKAEKEKMKKDWDGAEAVEGMEKTHIGFKKLEGKLEGKVSNPAAVAAKIGMEKYGKKRMEEAAQEGKPANKVKKSQINDLIEKNLDMDETQVQTAQLNKSSKPSGAFTVQSFSEEEMDSAFKIDDIWSK